MVSVLILRTFVVSQVVSWLNRLTIWNRLRLIDGSCSSDPMMTFAFYNLGTRRWLRCPSPEAQSLEQWGHWKSVVVITAEADLWYLSLAAVSFWHRASSKLAAAL